MGEAGRIVIDFCNGNLMEYTQELFLELRNDHPEFDVRRYGCLTNCGECAVRPFAIVNDKIIAAPDVEELRQLLAEELHIDL